MNNKSLSVILSDCTYSYLTPGGKQVHASKIFTCLKKLDVKVDYENWHYPTLAGNVVHFFGFNDIGKIKDLKKRGYKLLITHILDGPTNQSKYKKRYHSLKNKIINLFPEFFNVNFSWKGLRYFDAFVYMHTADRDTAVELYSIPIEKTYIIPHAVDSEIDYLGEDVINDSVKYLVSVGSIVPRKNSNFTAQLCKDIGVPIKFIGHPFDVNSKYFQDFISIAKDSSVEYIGYGDEITKINILKGASGFVLLSHGESGCISIYEAGACGLPLLLSDLPWAKGYGNSENIYFCSISDTKKAIKSLTAFYNGAVRNTHPSIEVRTWDDIAIMYKDIYISMLD